MATERPGLRLIAAALLAVCAAPAGARAHAATPWWELIGLPGQRVTAVRADGSTLIVQAESQVLRSTDGGHTFQPVSSATLTPPAYVISGSTAWTINPAGRVLRAPVTGTAVHAEQAMPDAAAPDLGAGAHLIAAPAALPGSVVAVATDNTVWRRAQDGGWSRALLLLPAGFPQGVPRVTAVTAFDRPLSASVYLATAGYAVLASADGGDDWIRAGPGLPGDVPALVADSRSRAVYAGTSDGLWVHHLQQLPAPPAYHDAALLWRWIGIVLVSLAAAALGAAALLRAVRIQPRS